MSIAGPILITGGAGMLAHAFRETCNSRGIESHLVTRADCDITNVAQILTVMDQYNPSTVINCAAYTKVDLAEKEKDAALTINGKAVGFVAEACRRRSLTLVHFSTDYVFDGSIRRPLRPADPLKPKSMYGISKLLGEQMLQEFAPPRWLILRTAWLYGPGGPNFPQTMLNAARAGKPLKVIRDQVGSPTFTFDLAAATLNLLATDANGIYHLSNSGSTNWFEFTQAIMEAFGVTPTSLDSITSADWKAIRPESANRPSYSVLDVTPYEQKTGETMPDWRDGLRRYRVSIE